MIFVDTWAWIALASKGDQNHRRVKALHKSFRRAGRRYVTSDFIISELIGHLYRMLTPAQAQGFVNTLFTAVDAGEHLLLHVSPAQFRGAWQLRQKYHDKPDISFVDFTSMVIMQDLQITDVFSGDSHFRQVNLGFQLHP